MWRTCKIWDFYTERFGAQRADKHEKTEFGIFLRAKRPIFKLRNITLNGINPQTNVTYMQIWDFYTEWFGLQRADKHEKTDFGKFFARQAPNYQITKRLAFTASTHIQMWHTCKIWGFYIERFGVQHADKHEKTDLGMFFAREAPNS